MKNPLYDTLITVFNELVIITAQKMSPTKSKNIYI